ncbi:DUF4350 domain-containing protein [Lysobacter silvisoli]|uniref:DUF4350 domain-containing protein n=1 Tax=Lysobacter silvisoli TaxID=2293254 RepID=A0A371JXS1_9GAMM|nr:DUF4350 domain-containing protein [Lysobacter silvisoli]RDZ26458.1 DUF4350 domain-containing protein [Lysobacter silvisoli]
MRTTALAALVLLAGLPAAAQQVADRDYRPDIAEPAYPAGQGPVLCLDEGHHNFHTLDGRYWTFGELLRRDGYRVQPLRARFDAAALKPCSILVIANAQPSDRPWNEYPSPTPSAFADAEVRAVKRWVERGGRLWLIADHMPLAGAAAPLARAFGIEFTDGFAMPGFDADPQRRAALFAEPTVFRRSDGTLAEHAVTRGANAGEAIEQVRSFTGQAFRLPPRAEAVLTLPPGYVSLQPAQAWQFHADTPRLDVGGWSQGAVLRLGKGRAAFFGEAAMFSAQRQGARGGPMGMNAPGAERNYQLALNIAHWLSGRLDAKPDHKGAVP